MGWQIKMRHPLGIILALTLACVLATTPGSRAQRAFLSKYIWRSKLQRPYMQIFREAHAPSEVAPTRFQRGVDPGDEGREVDMRMIFDELKRDMRAAMEEKEEEGDTRSSLKPYWRFSRGSPISPRTVWPEPEEKEEGYHIKQPSPYSLYKYRL